ncbi:MAG: hypothetical protein ABIK67_06015 [candidate division WOR-3 bacterium]
MDSLETVQPQTLSEETVPSKGLNYSFILGEVGFERLDNLNQSALGKGIRLGWIRIISYHSA